MHDVCILVQNYKSQVVQTSVYDKACTSVQDALTYSVEYQKSDQKSDTLLRAVDTVNC